MAKIQQKKTGYVDVELNAEETLEVVKQYLRSVIGDGCYITKNGKLEHWTKYPHGSGTTTDMGIPTPIQVAADALLSLV